LPPSRPATNAPESSVANVSAAPQIERGPHRDEIDDERQREVRGEPIRAHVDARRQPALHHVPAHRALRGGEHRQQHETRAKTGAHAAPH
jgi:hypothetical protein